MSLRELAIQQKSDFSYLYVIRLSDGAALYHPMLDIPTDGDEDSVVLNIRVLEREADENGIIDSMMRCGDDPTKNSGVPVAGHACCPCLCPNVGLPLFHPLPPAPYPKFYFSSPAISLALFLHSQIYLALFTHTIYITIYLSTPPYPSLYFSSIHISLTLFLLSPISITILLHSPYPWLYLSTPHIHYSLSPLQLYNWLYFPTPPISTALFLHSTVTGSISLLPNSRQISLDADHLSLPYLLPPYHLSESLFVNSTSSTSYINVILVWT